MDMIDEALNRLKARLTDLNMRIIPDLQSQTEFLYSRIIPMPEGKPEREKLEKEYTLLSKELSLRSKELTKIRGEMEHLEFEKTLKR